MRIRPSSLTETRHRTDSSDALALLSADHQQVTELFDEFESALENASAEQKQICERICHELEIHSQLEEEIFYPAIAREASIKPLVEEALKDHAEVKAAIRKIRNLQTDNPQFGTSMLQLMEDVELHVDEEENIIFEEVEKRLSGTLGGLGMQLKRRRHELVSSIGMSTGDSSMSAI